MVHVNVACLEGYTGCSQGVWRKRNFSGNDSSYRVVGSKNGLWDSQDDSEMMCFFFTFMWPCIVTNFFLIKPTDAPISQIYFCQETLHVSGSSSAHHQEFPTVHSALVYVMQVWWQLSSTTRMERLVVLKSCHQTCMAYTSAECTVEHSWWWAEELPETCRVSCQK